MRRISHGSLKVSLAVGISPVPTGEILTTPVSAQPRVLVTQLWVHVAQPWTRVAQLWDAWGLAISHGRLTVAISAGARR
jgi:hypothetical protein